MCAILLQPHGAKKDWFGRVWDFLFGWFFRLFNRTFDYASNGYARTVGSVVRRGFLGLVIYAILIGATFWGFQRVPTGFIPAQDRGYLITALQLPDGASLERTDEMIRRATDVILETEGTQFCVEFAGFSGATRSNSPNAAACFVGTASSGSNVKDGSAHSHGHDAKAPTAMELLETLQTKLNEFPEAQIFVIPPPPVQGLGTSGGFKFAVQDRAARGALALQEATDLLIARCRETPELAGVFTTYRASTPQLYANIDRVKANMLNVPLANIFDALQVNLGSAYVNDFNLYGRTFQVRAQAEGTARMDADSIRLLKTRNRNGSMVPLASVLDIEWRSGPDRVVRYNMFPAAEIQGGAAPGYSSGQAMAAVERLAAEVLPPGMTIEWTDLAFQERLAGNTAIYIFPLCVLFVFLVHAAEYESWSLPLAIILIAPLCIPFALLGVWMRGMDNNLITQIGFVVLIGLAAKNAVLIVEFAKQMEEEGRNRFDAAVEACRLRLRPILMTSFAFILGVLPLARAVGPGFEMRQVLGTAVFAGMLGVTAFGLFLTPVFYVVLRGITGGPVPGHRAHAPIDMAPAHAPAQPLAEPTLHTTIT
jgi:multidrug efflux pump